MSFKLYNDDQNAITQFPQESSDRSDIRENLLQIILDQVQTGIKVRQNRSIFDNQASIESEVGIDRTIFSPKFNKNVGIRTDLTPTINL